MDLQDDVAFVQAKCLGSIFIEDLGDFVDLCKVVARAERADLSQPALLGRFADLSGICARHAAALFGVRHIFGSGEAFAAGPAAAVGQDRVKLALVGV